MYSSTPSLSRSLSGVGMIDGVIDPRIQLSQNPIASPEMDGSHGRKRSRSPSPHDDEYPRRTYLSVEYTPNGTLKKDLEDFFSKQKGYTEMCFMTRQTCRVEFETESSAKRTIVELYDRPPHNSINSGTKTELSFSKYIPRVPPDPSRRKRLPRGIARSRSSEKAMPTKLGAQAIPALRDHTTDHLNYEEDEYIPREFDEAGERKISLTGEPLENRQFRMRTFQVPCRGEKRFMLATECARVLGYRDSYLLFDKNRALYKITATQQEKDELIHQEILPYSYRSRHITMVTAKSVFRNFGARVIEGGRRVRDDYWEAKAIRQGCTEDDLAGNNTYLYRSIPLFTSSLIYGR